jgi:GntR family transcriptional regulator
MDAISSATDSPLSLAPRVGPLDGTSSLPLYRPLQRALRSAIDHRILAPIDALPAERDQASDFSVSRTSVRKVLDGLVGQGLLMRRQGSRNFVSARVERNFALLTSFSEDLHARGLDPDHPPHLRKVTETT